MKEENKESYKKWYQIPLLLTHVRYIGQLHKKIKLLLSIQGDFVKIFKF